MGGRCNHRRPCRSPSDRAACGGREGGARLLDAKCNAGWPADVRGGRTRGEALKLAARGKAMHPASAAGRVAVGSSVGFTPASRVGLARKSDGDPIRRRRLGWSLAQEKNKHTGGARRRFERCLTRRFALPACLRGPSDIREPPWLAPGCVQIARRQTQSSRACLFLLSRVLDRGGSYLHD